LESTFHFTQAGRVLGTGRDLTKRAIKIALILDLNARHKRPSRKNREADPVMFFTGSPI